ncbi:MAG: hypothetical protein NDI88_08025 [Lysobacter sp.]|nr:hypothetical protein [Lysobacter sp.]
MIADVRRDLSPEPRSRKGETMVTRRTTMRSRSGTKLYAVRDESGQFKDIQSYKRAHSADLRQKSAAETVAGQGPIEKKVRKAAKSAVKSVKDTVSGAVAAVQKVAKRAVKQVSGKQPPKVKAARKAAKKVAAKSRKPAAKKAVKKATKKTAKKTAK